MQIICGDSHQEMKNIKDESVDCIITDPPYGMSFQSNMRTKTLKFDLIKDDDNLDNVLVLFSEMYRVLKNNTHIYIFCSWHNVDKFKIEFEKYFKLKNILVWYKDVHTMGDLHGQYAPRYEFILFGHKGRRLLNKGRHPDVLPFKKVPPNHLVHSNEKPVELLKFLIEKSTDEGELILDCYAGSGTVPLACKSLNRDCIAIEIDQKYINIINKRLNQQVL